MTKFLRPVLLFNSIESFVPQIFNFFRFFLGVKIKFAKAIEATKNLNKNSIGRYNVTQRKFSRKNEKSYELYSV